MIFFTQIFRNEYEGRIRALWRLLIQQVLWLVIAIIFLLPLPALKNSPPEQSILLEKAVEFTGALLAVWLVGHSFDKRPFRDFGLRFNKAWFIDFGFGLFLGGFLITLVFLIELTAGWITITGVFVSNSPENSFTTAILYAVVFMLIVGVQEELTFRGYQLTNLAEGLNWKRLGPRGATITAVVLSAAFFALMHVNNPHTSAISTFSVFMGGIILALGFILTGELAIPIGLHITWNFFQANVFGLTLSGGDYSWATFFATEQSGPALWVGDAFGPESGLLAIGTVLLGCAMILLWVRLRYGHIKVHTSIAMSPENLDLSV